MKMKVLAAAVLISTTSVANAGFFDSLFASKEETPVATVKQATVTSVTEASSTIETATATPAVEASSTIDTATNIAGGLLPSLTEQLGVTESQATGGMGSLMQLAKSSLSTDEFSELSNSVPNMSTLLAAAPLLTSGDSSIAGVTDLLGDAGGMASSLSSIATLTKQFEALGLSSDMIAQFANIAMSYFSTDSSSAGSLLQKGLGSILG